MDKNEEIFFRNLIHVLIFVCIIKYIKTACLKYYTK